MKFSFVVLTFNHEQFIAEHLESIRFLIEQYGKNYSVQLIIADDCSVDRTTEIAKLWVAQNRHLFVDAQILENRNNIGTCLNYTRTWKLITGDYYKITAGDDVYSFENIFEIIKLTDQYDIVAGLPLIMVEGALLNSKVVHFHMIATDVVFQDRPYLKRLQEVSYSNTPNMLFPKKILESVKTRNFIERFAVTEDFPQLISMCEEYWPLKTLLADVVLVYYRRTFNSTYLIKSNSFNKDKLELFRYLIEKKQAFFSRFLLRVRLMFYLKNKNLLSYFLDPNYLIYGVKVWIKLFIVLCRVYKLPINYKNHRKHFELIKFRSKLFAAQNGFAPSESTWSK